MNNPNANYNLKTDQYDVSFEQYNSFDKKYGDFSNSGDEYTVTDCNTPRQWFNYMVNDHFGSVVASDGTGFIFCEMPIFHPTKYYSNTDYLIRTLNGKKLIRLTSKKSKKSYDFFEAEGLTYTVGCGYSIFERKIEDTSFKVTFFVPNEDCCECWIISSEGGNGAEFELTVAQDFMSRHTDIAGKSDSGKVYAEVVARHNDRLWQSLFSVFALDGADVSTEYYSEPDIKSDAGECYKFLKATLTKSIKTGGKELVIAGAAYKENSDDVYKLFNKYTCADAAEAELQKVNSKWAKIKNTNICELPDKNLQRFLNYWLKNQLYLTSRYNRAGVMGYRDVMQDAWGALLVEPEFSRVKFLEGLSKMYTDGRCPRQYNKTSDYLDERDFMDSPLWAVITLVDYIKETGDFSILDEEVGYYGSDKKNGVLDHILLSLDYLYRSRGKNGLILMRSGDWLDGLGGINKYGEATTVWGTIAAFYVQNLLSELFDKIGDSEKAELMRARSAEYKEIVNSVGWDGNWYTYAFIDDEPIGSHKCHEGKIYLNAQTWAIFSGIYDSEDKFERMYRAINTYLSTMYGPLLLAPAYKKFGERCGRIQKQVPGTFANSAIYLHAASFKVFADCAAGKYNDALDSLQRIFPGHTDSCDGRRTSEPYCVGNVYYGPEHRCFGENLYSWFTATPAWLIHDGFEGLLGVKAEFDGLSVKPTGISGWDRYSVTKKYRNTEYRIEFMRGSEKGIFADGKKICGNLLNSSSDVCNVAVVY